MKGEYIVDLHIHSPWARACSPQLTLENIYRWCKIKGITVIGVGDFTHPQRFQEIKKKLVPAEEGLFCLHPRWAKENDKLIPQSVRHNEVRFLLSTEISTIYSKYGRLRKLHQLILLPDLSTVAEFNRQLQKIGKLASDGRPILGLESKELLKMTLQLHPQALFIPAHIWTPHFSLFGSNSGFDSLEEAFEELSGEIKAVETGLSSDPFMNWRLSQLDGLTLVSGSDAHSLPKMAREAIILRAPLNYSAIRQAIVSGNDDFIGTIEFFPEEGKYHYDGHRRCGVVLNPRQTKKYQGLCPKCGRPLTRGVLHRVEELADREPDYRPLQHKKVEYIIPLVEILAELIGVKGSNSRRVEKIYQQLYQKLGDEFRILRQVDVEEIKEAGFPQLAQAIQRLREKKVAVQPGYDGVYGIIRLFADSTSLPPHSEQLNFSI